MGSGLYKTSSKLYKNIQRVLLCIVLGTLSFIFSCLVFQSALYALPLCTLFTLSVSMFSSNAVWGAVVVSTAIITLFLLDRTFNADDASVLPIAFIVYTGAASVAAALLANRIYWRIRQQRDSYREQASRERSLSQLSTAMLTASSADELYDLTVRSIFASPAVLLCFLSSIRMVNCSGRQAVSRGFCFIRAMMQYTPA